MACYPSLLAHAARFVCHYFFESSRLQNIPPGPIVLKMQVDNAVIALTERVEFMEKFMDKKILGRTMVTLHPEYVVDEQQNRKAVLLPAAEWEQILLELEELDDLRAYDAAERHRSDRLPFEQAVREIQEGL